MSSCGVSCDEVFIQHGFGIYPVSRESGRIRRPQTVYLAPLADQNDESVILSQNGKSKIQTTARGIFAEKHIPPVRPPGRFHSQPTLFLPDIHTRESAFQVGTRDRLSLICICIRRKTQTDAKHNTKHAPTNTVGERCQFPLLSLCFFTNTVEPSLFPIPLLTLYTTKRSRSRYPDDLRWYLYI